MGGGGLMQLVAYGAQDIYLTGNPQITFFKVVYRRHTNFAMENIQQSFSGTANFGSRSTVIVSRNGDLINSAYLQVQLPALSNGDANITAASEVSQSGISAASQFELVWTNFVGLAMIDHVTVEIGGQQIDKHYGQWMYAWQELTMTAEKAQGYKRMVGGNDAAGWLLLGNAQAPQELHVPLDFWFNINAGLSLPLIALQYHEVRFVFNFRDVRELVVVVDKSNGEHLDQKYWSLTSPAQITPQIDLFIDYIYLDTDERRRFAQMSHEYLIEQVQNSPAQSYSTSSSQIAPRLTFNHPCKELVWFLQRQDCLENNDWFNFSNSLPGNEKLGPDMMLSAVLRLNGHMRFNPARGPLFFRQWQPFIHHTNVPSSCLYVYSFALRPEEHQPSGTCNFSRIDNTTLELSLDTRDSIPQTVPDVPNAPAAKNATLTVYARNYNVLRIMSGMGGLAYSN
jgi:hypothetical protein